MVLLDEDYTICTIRNTIENSEIKKLSLTVRPSYTVSKLYSDVSTQLDIQDFVLVLENLPLTNHIPLSLKENKTLGEVGIVFKKSHRNIILVLPPVGIKKNPEKNIPESNLICDAQLEPLNTKDQLKNDSIQINTVTPEIEVKSDVPAKKKIIKVKTVKTGTKTVKIKSEKVTTTTTSENGVTEVKKKTVKKQTDTTTIQLPNGKTNGLTSEQCIVTNSVHTTNGDHFEEQNIEVSSCQSEVHSVNTNEELPLKDRCSVSSELDVSESTNSIEYNQPKVYENGIDNKSNVKNGSLSPIEVASFNFVVGKKNSKPKLLTESENNFVPQINDSKSSNSDVSVVSDYKQEPVELTDISKSQRTEAATTEHKLHDLSSTTENEVSEEKKLFQVNTSDKTETCVPPEHIPTHFPIDVTVSCADQVNQSEKETTKPFLRSEVSPARFTIKLAKKKVEPSEEVDLKAKFDSNTESCTNGEVKTNEIIPTAEVNCESKAEVSTPSKLSDISNVLSEVDAKAEVTLEAESVPKIEVEVSSSNQDEIAPLAEVVVSHAENTSETEISPKPKTELKVEIKSKLNAVAKVGSESEIVSKKADAGPKKIKKTLENQSADSAVTGEVKKKLTKKIKDSTSPPSEIKKKIVKKVVGASSGVTENGIGEVKVKVLKKKSESSSVSDVVPKEKVKVSKKKLEPVVSTNQELNAIEDHLKLNPIEEIKVEEPIKVIENIKREDPIQSVKIEEPEQTISDNIEPVEKVEVTKIVSKMDDDSDTKNYYGETPLYIETTHHQLDLSMPLSDVDRKNMRLEEDLALGASASPVESKLETSNHYIPLAICEAPSSSTDYSGKLYSCPKPSYGYVGLVNQAMTCYLNSLLQALFMTPEFRNALYNWEFDGHEESKSIPYQLQKLFLNLQTSTKAAIETTDLTKSFGWTSSDAWHQHDVQELCRVMFDALEQKFKNTKQADLINRLYEGKMIDYVKCLECSTEKTREDTLLDIPLPVRPFGSNVAYGSVEEAIRAFVQPETLDGNNQYFCDKCNKKCDAHKGLKFTKFPYILTLHLKRFDFDYNTLHRIKLNDKVTFPQLLNLNSFVKESDNIGFVQHTTNGGCSSEHGSIESAIKCDDCSTTDSGSALEEEGTTFTATSNNNNDGDLQEDDEGIDMSASTDAKTATSNESGPYIYELFAIMIHSGSASGGHYYAYIRDFNNGEWYCFNDQTVTSASHEDIERSFGGGSTKTYYSSAYNSSTNAYMLMYRQQDPLRNDAAIKVNEFPPHIQKLLRDLRHREEMERENRARETELLKLKVYFFNPKTQRMQDARIFMPSDSDLKMTLEDAHSHFNIEKLAPIERCRLVGYSHSDGNIIRSYEGKEEQTLTKALFDLSPLELLLEVRSEDKEFEIYPPGGVLTKLHKVDLATGDVDLPITFRAITSWSVLEYKTNIAKKLELNVDQIIVAVLKSYSNNAKIICDDIPHRIGKQDRVFAAVSTSPCEDGSKLTKIVERFEHIITLFFLLPATDKETLEKMSIPSYVDKSNHSPTSTIKSSTPSPQKSTVSTDVVDAVMHAAPLHQNHTSTSDSNYHQVPLQLELESCSEDSSLSDGDRTLVDSAPNMADVSSRNNSPTYSDRHISSMDCHSKCYNEFDCDDDNETEVTKTRNYYFKAVYFEEPYKDDENIKTNRMLKVLVDKGMIIGNLKRALEPFIKVPKEYFKIFKTSSNTETECHRLTESLNIFSDNERLVIELGRALRKGEYKCKISYLKLSQIKDDMEQLTFMCDWILRNGANVGQTKREIIAHLATLGHDFQYENCRLRHQNRRLPTEIYVDDQKFGDDIRLSENMEVILQELEETSQPYTDANDKCLFVRRWSPSTMTIGGFQEITISENSEIKNILSSISGIPEENVEYALPTGLFPRYNLNILTIHTTLTWYSSTVKSDEWPLNLAHNSDCFIYRDKTEILKQLTPEESRELKNKERLRTGGSSTYSSYSPRRERGLKIDV